MISVVIPLFNKRDSIRSTIESVLSQSYSNFELIVVDDGSTDGSADSVREINDGRVRLITKTNGGVSSARNEGIRHAKGEWVAFLDADDLWENDFLAEIYKMIHDFPQAGIMGTSFYTLESGNKIETEMPLPEGYYGMIDNITWDKAHIYWSSAVCCRKDALKRVGMFDERIAYGEDLDMWWRIMLLFPSCYSNRELAIYRLDENNRAMNRAIPLEKLYLYFFEKYEQDRKENAAFRHFIDKECMGWLFPYALEDKRNPDVRRILSQIDLSEYRLSFRFRFRHPKLYKLLRK